MSLLNFFHREANEDVQEDVSKSTMNKESNGDETSVIIRSPQTATVYLSSTKRPRSSGSSPGINLQKRSREGSNVEDSNTDEEEMAEDEPRPPSWVKDLILQIADVKNSVAGLANIGSELTKLMNSFIAFKSEITQKMINLENSVDFCSKSYDDMKRANDVAVTRITQLEQQNADLHRKVQTAMSEVDNLQQYSRRNCLLFYGITESSDEDTDQLVIDQCNEKLNLSITRDILERTHRLGPKREQGGKPRAIIVKFCSYRNRRLVFINKKRLKGTGVMITESLTKARMKLVKEVHKIVGDGNTWNSDGNVFAKKGQRIFKLTIKDDITQLTA